MKALRWLFILVAVIALAFVARVYFYGPAKGLFYRTFRTPSVLHATFIEDFSQQQSQIQRERLLSVYQSHNGSFGLRKSVGSIEGTPIGECLVVEDGRLTIISDYTRDAYGSREFGIRYPTNVVLEAVTAAEELVPFTPPQGRVVLKCYFDKGVFYY